ncbi:MAG TPA: bifunctional nicotinamidase/pyrazinamidase [Coriobacteriia bacterium]|jgi:nicotinamidase/pyrazinamidase
MRALLLIDIQNDFMPGGALAVPDGDAVVPVADALMPKFSLVIATQDWHPADHGSFAVNHPGNVPGDIIELGGVPQVLWPAHCVQDTPGASFHPDLDVAGIDDVVRKGTDPAVDSYSGFFDNARRHATGLDEYLKARDVDELVVAGLATDYCVRATCLDGVDLGYAVTLVEDGCRAVNLAPDDGELAIEQMRLAGVAIARSSDILASAG